MRYIKAEKNDVQTVFEIVQNTIKAIYPKYYPQEVVDFFCELHRVENIENDIINNSVGILFVNQTAVGTGCYADNHITRVYVLPEYQKKGFGTYIMDRLEDEISKEYNSVYLDASLPAESMYKKRGYTTKEHCEFEVENGIILGYNVMTKNMI